ncbi:MAG: acetoacetate decarboxylase family protein [Agrococcus casei]|uniref:acetoacetate decarboxylase family protein n=1 Tax=Agrococcus casei TaxID=343512 RepID=UPI003F95B76E
MTYDIRRFAEYTGQMPGDSTYEVENLEQLWVYCRGNSTQLQHLVGYLPFELQDDVFVLGVGDYSTGPGWMDASVLLPVAFEGQTGGTYLFEYEDQHASVAMGREAWGYPKAFARVDMLRVDNRVSARVKDYDQHVFGVEATLDNSVDDSAWSHLSLYPQFQVRAVPEKNGPGFDSFDVVSRDPSVDYVAKSRRTGTADVSIGRIDIANGILGGEPLEVVTVLGAELLVGDYKSTAANGVPRVVKSFL